ncbi:MAG: FHA domain-containing protein [Bacteroidia bacterium]|nr:FHA domain-containing protein [Bacteroidia bacterium]
MGHLHPHGFGFDRANMMQPGHNNSPQGAPAFALTEMLQHHAQTGRTGMFEVHLATDKARIYLMTGIVAHAEIGNLTGELAVWEVLAAHSPSYQWLDGKTPTHMTMSSSAQELLLRFIQLQGSGELDRLRQEGKSFSVTRNLDDSGMLFIMSLDVQSREISPFNFVIQTRQVRMGRHTDNELVLSDTSVSRKHAILILNNDSVLVRDLGSKNGITINAQPVTQGLMRDGDVLTVGEVILKLNVSRTAKTGRVPTTARLRTL